MCAETTDPSMNVTMSELLDSTDSGVSSTPSLWKEASFDHSLDALLIANDQARYVAANDAACELTGYERTELLQLCIADLLDERFLEGRSEQWERFLKEGRISGEIALIHKDGSALEIEFQAVANVAPGLHLNTLRDISERKRAERALSAELRDAARLEGILQTVRTLRHEVNNPLQALCLTLDLLERQPNLSDDCSQTRLIRLKEATDRITTLLNRLKNAPHAPTIPTPGGEMLHLTDGPIDYS
jgi:PAS domain S-box-containing protein